MKIYFYIISEIIIPILSNFFHKINYYDNSCSYRETICKCRC